MNDNGSIYLPHNTTHNFRAVERIVLADYNKVFKTWSKDGINETSSYSSNITLPSQGSIKEVVTNISAEYNSEFEITKIFIDNSTNNAICNSETIDLLDDAPQTLTATKTINGVVYNCTGWKNADDVVVSSNYYYTFTPTVKASYKAMLSPKPAVKYFNYDGATGQNIHLTWSENSGDDSRISHYQIWRRVRHNNTTGNPQLIATLNRGTTEFTDYDYKYTSYYSDDLLWYDVRVQMDLNTGPVFSDENFVSVFGAVEPSVFNNPIVSKANISPEEYSLISYPNPFNPTAVLRYTLPEEANVLLKLYNILSQEVSTLVNEEKRAGVHTCSFNAINLPSGIYIARLQAGAKVVATKLRLVK